MSYTTKKGWLSRPVQITLLVIVLLVLGFFTVQYFSPDTFKCLFKDCNAPYLDSSWYTERFEQEPSPQRPLLIKHIQGISKKIVADLGYYNKRSTPVNNVLFAFEKCIDKQERAIEETSLPTILSLKKNVESADWNSFRIIIKIPPALNTGEYICNFVAIDNPQNKSEGVEALAAAIANTAGDPTKNSIAESKQINITVMATNITVTP